MAYQDIDVGTVNMDGSGDPIGGNGTPKSALKKSKEMFLELFEFLGIGPVPGVAGVYLGCCQGNLYPEFRKGFKMFGVNHNSGSEFYYVSKFICGTGTGTLTYTIEISKAANIFAVGSVVLSRTYLHAELTGLWQCQLQQANSSSLTGGIEIDMDQFTTGETYTCVSWVEGGLFAVNLYSAVSTGGGGMPTDLPKETGNFTADGTLKEYIYNGAGGHTATIGDIADIVADITIINASGNDLAFLAHGGLSIGGYISGVIHTGGFLKVIADNAEFQAYGNGFTYDAL